MKKFNPQALIESFLFNAPHHQIQRMQKMVPYSLKDVSNISDDTYMDNFIYHVHCEYLTSQEFLYTRNKKMRLMTDNMFLQHMQNILAIRQGKEWKGELEKKLISSIKKLNDNRDQTEELVATMDAKQASQNKKYLIYIYKWALNQKAKTIQIGYQELMEQLKTAVVNKIYEAHSKTEDKQRIEIQLKKYQRLAEARTCIAQGNLDQAKASYEQIFEDQTNDANARMEALEYLCKNSQERGDENYLLGIMTRLKESNGEERHRKYVENVLSQLNTRSSQTTRKNDSTQRKQQ